MEIHLPKFMFRHSPDCSLGSATFVLCVRSDCPPQRRDWQRPVANIRARVGCHISRYFSRSGRLRPAAAYLYDMWRRGMVLKEWTIEYNAFRWEILRASSPAESDLLDARFHVANAEVFTEALSKSTRAIRELDRAEISLRAAETLVKPSLARQVKTIDDEITAAETHEQAEDTFSTMPFETIKVHLDHLIAMVRSARISGESNRAISVQG